MPMGLKKVLEVGPPFVKSPEPLPPRVNTVPLGEIPRMRLLVLSAT